MTMEEFMEEHPEACCGYVSLEVWDDPSISNEAILWACWDQFVSTYQAGMKLLITGDYP